MAKFGEVVLAGIIGAIFLAILSPLIVSIISNAVAGNYLITALGFALQGCIIGMITQIKTK